MDFNFCKLTGQEEINLLSNMEDFKLEIKDKKPGTITFNSDNDWVMKITKGKIIFNREYFPDLCEDEFAYGVLAILEKANVIQIDQSQWDNGRIKIEH